MLVAMVAMAAVVAMVAMVVVNRWQPTSGPWCLAAHVWRWAAACGRQQAASQQGGARTFFPGAFQSSRSSI